MGRQYVGYDVDRCDLESIMTLVEAVEEESQIFFGQILPSSMSAFQNIANGHLTYLVEKTTEPQAQESPFPDRCLVASDGGNHEVVEHCHKV